MAFGPITLWQIEGEKVKTVTDSLFLGSKITVYGDCRHESIRWLILGRKALTNLDSVLKSKDITLPTKIYIVKAMVFPGDVQMWELDHKYGRMPKKLMLSNLMLEKTLESPLDCKEIKPVNHKGSQPRIHTRGTDGEAEAPTLWPLDVNNWLIGEDTDAGKERRQKEKRATEDERVGWHHQGNGHELRQTPGDSEGQRSLACCSPWGRKDSDTTWCLDNNNM